MKASILMFHRIIPKRLIGPLNAYRDRGTLISLAFFEQVLERLRNRNVISLAAFHEAQLKGQISGDEVVLTFDDGYYDTFQYVMPLLQSYGYPAILYPTLHPCIHDTVLPLDFYYHLIDRDISLSEIRNPYIFGKKRQQFNGLSTVDQWRFCTAWMTRLQLTFFDLIPDRLYMNQEELTRWVAEGFELGGHTQNHCILPLTAPSIVSSELRTSREFIQLLQPEAPISFAYPDGQFDLKSQKLVAEEGYFAALTVQKFLDQPYHPYQIPRLFVTENFDLQTI